MLRVTTCISISWLCISSFGLQAQDALMHHMVLQAAELSICGSTNVNSFNCSLRKVNMGDTLSANGASGSGLSALNGIEIAFKVEDFACDLALMTRDFRSLLKYDLHPQIIMKIDELIYKEAKQAGSTGEVSASVTLSIAGQDGRELIRAANVHKIKQKIIFTGSHEVLMTKFNIEPPSRLFGAVKARDLLIIDFAIQLQ